MSKTFEPYPAPDFSLVDSESVRYGLHSFRGSWLVVYFYPKDDTPGCTIEACTLRDARDTLAEMGVHIVGISMDTPDSHEAFRKKHNLNFALLSDPTGETIRVYGAWGKKMFGNEGIQRKTFLIDPKGMVQKVYGRVTPLRHGEQIIKDITKLRRS